MYRNVGACTTPGLRACMRVPHDAATMKTAEGTIEKKSCSNSRLKSKLLLFSCSSVLPSNVKGMIGGCGKGCRRQESEKIAYVRLVVSRLLADVLRRHARSAKNVPEG